MSFSLTKIPASSVSFPPFSTLYFLSVRWTCIRIHLLRLAYTRSPYSVVLHLYTAAFYSSTIPPPPFHSSPRVTIHQLFPSSSRQNSPREHPLAPSIPLHHLLLPHRRPSFPSDAVTGVAPAPNSYKIDGQEPHRQRGWRVTPSGITSLPLRLSFLVPNPPPPPPSIRPSFTVYAAVPVCAYTLHPHAHRRARVRVRATAWQLDECGGGGERSKSETESEPLVRQGGRERGVVGRVERRGRSEEIVRSEERGVDEDVKLNADE